MNYFSFVLYFSFFFPILKFLTSLSQTERQDICFNKRYDYINNFQDLFYEFGPIIINMLFNKYLLNIYYMPDIVLDAGETVVKKQKNILA